MTRRRLTQLVTLALAVAVAVAAGGCAFSGETEWYEVPGDCITTANLDPILTTIRTIESGGQYPIAKNKGGASGAYQYVDSTWNGYGGYESAYQAPPEVQDAKAAADVQAILQRADHDVAAVPVGWYWPIALSDLAQLDIVPRPSAGNKLTVRQYQAKWLALYEQILAGATVLPGQCTAAVYPGEGGPLPDRLECSQITWFGHRNGYVPSAALAYNKVSGYLHPAASASYAAMAAAAEHDGINIRGTGYRAAADQATVAAGGTGAKVGTSCHGLGLAIDIDVLVPDNRYPATADAFASAEYRWLCANAATYGWINPRWAQPNGASCGPVTGNGTGGGTAGVLEPWHWEAALVGTRHPDFAP